MRLIHWILLAGSLGILLLLFLFDPECYQLMPKCIFKVMTGLNCPACGIQRALHALLHGELLHALSFNYYLIISGPYVLTLIFERWVLPQGILQSKIHNVAESPFMIWFYIVTFFIWGVLRNILGI